MPTLQQLQAVYGNIGAQNIMNLINQASAGNFYAANQLFQFAPEVYTQTFGTLGIDPHDPQGHLNPDFFQVQGGAGQSPGPAGGAVNEPQGTIPSGASPNDKVNTFVGGLIEEPFYWTPSFQEIVNQFTSDAGRTLPNQQAASNWVANFKSYASTFGNQFKNFVGRDPTPEEYNTFFSEVIIPMQPWFQTPEKLQVSQLASDVLAKNFSTLAQEEAQKKAEGQAQSLVAPGSPFDIWQQAYLSSISDTEKSLQDYQTKLFEKLRPSLLTSLQAQGLLNTGALETTFAGAAKDLSEASQNYLANLKSQAATDIAGQKYAIQSAPGQFGLQNIFAVPGNLTAYGQNALQNAFQYNLQTQLANIAKSAQPQYKQASPLTQFGGLLAGGLIGGFGKGAGSGLAGKLFASPVGVQEYGEK